ncbi:hypothetical protein [Mesorhizobium caraganae]|uniref:hypothetical protein n=1 Tax=Mesorhizobium caraganae TaxID=483206 RepID=UPI00177B667E|nr:hypothetical protein [Mesorhizobium caraganae]
MEGSKIIVAIDKGAKAPIFSEADYPIVGDEFHILPECERAVDAASIQTYATSQGVPARQRAWASAGPTILRHW